MDTGWPHTKSAPRAFKRKEGTEEKEEEQFTDLIIVFIKTYGTSIEK